MKQNLPIFADTLPKNLPWKKLHSLSSFSVLLRQPVARIVKVLTLSLLLSACTIFQDPEPLGELPVNPASYWQNSEPYINPSLEVSDDITYFQTDQPHALAELVDLGLTNNPLTALAWAQAKSQAYTFKSSLSLLLPRIDWQGNHSFIQQRVGIKHLPANDTGQFTTLTSDFTIDYLIFDFGGRQGTIESAWQGLVFANLIHNQLIQDVTILVINNYYNYLQNKALLDARKEDLKNLQETYDATRVQFENGIVTIVDTLQAESNLAKAVLAFQQQENLFITSLAALATAVGLPANTKFEVEERPFTVPEEQIKADVEYLFSVAKRERNDLASKQAAFMQQRANLQVIKSSAMPTVTTQTDIINSRYTASNISYSNQYIATFSLNIPIFAGFFFTNQIRKAKADVLAAYEDWRDSEQQVLLDVFTNYYNFQTAIDSLSAADEFLKASQEAYDGLLAQYQTGVATITDVLTAEATLADARSQQIISRISVQTTFASLAHAMGILNVTNDYSILYPLKTEALHSCR